jgi:glycosyltransferase involved in cell wall biosynthesis
VFDVATAMKKTHAIAMVSLKRGSMGHEFAQAFDMVIYPEELCTSSNEYDQALEVLKQVRPGLVYANSIVSHQFARAAKELGIPVVFHVHELDIAFQIVFGKKGREEFKTLADVFIAVSQPVYDLLVDTYGCPRESVHLIHEFVSREKIIAQASAVDAALVQKELRVEPEDVVVLALGTFIYRKGADMFMQMAKALKEKGVQVHFVWIGSRPFKEPFMADFKTYAPYFSLLQEKVNPFPYLEAADIVILPSREDPFPLVILEAMALKKPTIVFSDAGGIKDAVKDAGVIVPHFDKERFQDEIEYLVQDVAKREVLGARAVEYQLEYDSSVILPQIEELVVSLLNKKGDN